MEQFLTYEEVAALLHVDQVTIGHLINKGELSAYRIGEQYRCAPSDLEDYLQRQRISARARDESETDPFTPLLLQVVQHPTLSELVGQFDYRFTKPARNVLRLAEEEARQFQHHELGTEHLLLGLVRQREGVGAQLLLTLGIEEHQARSALEALMMRDEQRAADEVGVSPRAKMVLILAMEEARQRHRRCIGTDHLLLGILRERKGMGGAVLETLGVVEQVRTETIFALRESQQDELMR